MGQSPPPLWGEEGDRMSKAEEKLLIQETAMCDYPGDDRSERRSSLNQESGPQFGDKTISLVGFNCWEGSIPCLRKSCCCCCCCLMCISRWRIARTGSSYRKRTTKSCRSLLISQWWLHWQEAVQVMKGPYHYTKVQSFYETEEEKRHRKAQFLIYKMMEKADSLTKRPLPLRVRICRLRVKIGRRIRRLRNKMQFVVSFVKAGICGQLLGQLKMVKRLLHGRGAIASLSPPTY